MPESSQKARARAAAHKALRLDLCSIPANPDRWYRKTPDWALWEGPLAPAVASSRPVEAARIILWATHPLRTPKGRCVALEKGASGLRVAVIQDGQRRWHPVSAIMGEEQARRWAREGFSG